MMAPALRGLLPALVVACGVPTAPYARAAAAKSVTYACDDGSRISVTYVNQIAALRDPTGLVVTMSQHRSRSGLWYEGQGQALRDAGNAVTWKPAGGDPIACHAVEAAPTGALADTSWKLDSVGGVRPDDPARYTIAFLAEGRAALRLDCNRVSGAWSADGAGGLRFGPMAMTRAACPDGSLDTKVAAALARVRGYRVEDGRLIMRLEGDAVSPTGDPSGNPTGSLTWARTP